MINAKEANLNTKTAIEKFAKEFIWNECGSKIQSAIDVGLFYTTVSLSKVDNPQHVGPVVIELLKKEYGYDAKYFCSENNYDDTGYISIDWSNVK